MKTLSRKIFLNLFFLFLVPLTIFAKDVTENVETVSVKLLSSATILVPQSWIRAKEAYDGTTSTWSTNNSNAVQFAWKSYDRCDIRLLNPAMYATSPIEVYYDFSYCPNAILTNVRLVWTIVIDNSGQIYSLSPNWYTNPIALGGSGSVEIDVNAAADADKTVIFTSSDTTIVKVEATAPTKAVMWGMGVGKAKITAAAAAKPIIKYTFEVEVKAPNVGDTFYYDGVTYQVTDTRKKECRVGDLHDYGNVTVWERAVGQKRTGKITIPSTVYGYKVTSIGEDAFYECENISEVVISEGITVISKNAFYGCSGLTSVSIPNSVTTIGERAFQNCSNLPSITLPNSITSIDVCTFSGCQSLANIILPDDIQSIGVYAFYKTPWLDSKPDGVVYIGKIAYLYKGSVPEKTTIRIKEGTIGIGGYFANWYLCSNSYNIVGLEIPASVTSIGDWAFSECDYLNKIRSQVKYPFNITNTTFADNTKKGVLFVPVGSKPLYQATEGWDKFNNIMEDEERENLPINETNFPDEIFRNYLLSQDYGRDGVLTDSEIQSLTEINVLGLGISNLKGIEYLIFLEQIHAARNNLSSIDVSNNKQLFSLGLAGNKLISLDLTNNVKLLSVGCNRNQIRGKAMDDLISSLPQNNTSTKHEFKCIQPASEIEGNVCTKEQVAAIKAKGWTPMYWDEEESKWKEYEGSDKVSGPTSISLPVSQSVEEGKTLQLTPMIKPADAETTLTWETDDASIAKVTQKGLVMGIKEGMAIITVKTDNNLSAECFVKVVAPSGILDVVGKGQTEQPVFTLSGQRLVAPRRGLNIVGGKKVVVR